VIWGNWCRGGSRCRGTDGYKQRDTDFAFTPIRRNLISNSYYIEREESYESDEVSELKNNFSEVRKLTKGKNFYNKWQLLGFIQSKGKYKIEEEVLEYILKESPSFDISSDYRRFKNYVFGYFINPSIFLTENHQYSRAKWMLNEGIKRLLIIDTPPLNNTSYDYRSDLNLTIVLRCLIENPHEANLETSHFNQIFKIVTNAENFTEIYSKINNVTITKESNLYPYILYLNGTKQLKERKIKEAFKLFKEVNKLNKTNQYLKQLNFHLMARCIFWSCHDKNLKGKQKAISQLKKIKTRISILNLQNDIDYYIDYLLNPPDDHFQSDEEENDKIDFTLDLNL